MDEPKEMATCHSVATLFGTPAVTIGIIIYIFDTVLSNVMKAYTIFKSIHTCFVHRDCLLVPQLSRMIKIQHVVSHTALSGLAQSFCLSSQILLYSLKITNNDLGLFVLQYMFFSPQVLLTKAVYPQNYGGILTPLNIR